MALNETKKKNLEDKDFDDLYNDRNKKPKWAQLAANAYNYAKENTTHGKEPRLDDVSVVLYPVIEADLDFRAHQDANNARGKRFALWFTEYIVDRVVGEGRDNTE